MEDSKAGAKISCVFEGDIATKNLPGVILRSSTNLSYILSKALT